MKRKSLILFCAALLIAVSAAGCDSEDDNIDISANSTAADNINLNDAESVNIRAFKVGKWQGKDSNIYYFRDNNSGATENSAGTGSSFRYEFKKDGTATFYMGAGSNTKSAKVTFKSTEEAELEWEDGTIEKLVYLSAELPDKIEDDESSSAEDSNEDSENSSAEEQQDSDDNGDSENIGHTAPMFSEGAWAGENGYYIFEGASGGATRSYDMGIGVAFEYEMKNDKDVVFHMGGAENNSNASVSLNGDKIVINWENGGSETLEYVGYYTVSGFSFCTNDQLCELALDYYEKQNGTRPSKAAADSGNIATVQLYDNAGDHNSTAAWYTIDRITLKGTDVNTSEEVDFN